MHHASTQLQGWQIDSWEASSSRGPSQDAKLVAVQGNRLRLAVIDGIGSTRETFDRLGVEGSLYSSVLLRLAFQKSRASLKQAVLSANYSLHDPALERSCDQMQACASAVDIEANGRLKLVRAGGCDVWARDKQGQWHDIGNSDVISAQARRLYQQWHLDNPNASSQEIDAFEEELLGKQESWTTCTVGRFPEPHFFEHSMVGVKELVLASDGARLHRAALDQLPRWMSSLRKYEQERYGNAIDAHDDATVLRIRRLPR